MTDDKSAAPERLKPCPFCGRPGKILPGMGGLVGCHPCALARRDAASWNRRDTPARRRRTPERLDTPAPPTQADPADAVREALAVFAKLADSYEPLDGDDDDRCWHTIAVPTIGDLRRARAALAAAPAPQPAQMDREALERIIYNAPDAYIEEHDRRAIADALLARGLRLPTEGEAK